MTHEQIKAKIQTPMSKSDPTDVKIESIPLPPPEMWGQLDNSTTDIAAETGAETPVAPLTPVGYFGNIGRKDVPLKGSYVNPDGTRLVAVTIRRLTLGEVQDLLAKTSGKPLLIMDIYAEMTGLTVEALRGLDDDDGVAVTDEAYDFLPRRFKTDDGSSAT
jgi:hypothetical protein